MTLTDFAALEAALRERTNYELRRPPPGGWGLDRMARLLERLGDPQLSYPVIHVAGTTGKGTTCAAIASALDHAGLRVGLTTSPHLVTLGERIRIGAAPAPEPLWLQAAETVFAAGDPDDPPTYFELVVAMAFVAFRDAKVDAAVVEVGLGGRLDATNCVRPTVSVITRIGLDHGELLGNTLESVAAEKAGVIKPGVPVIAGAGSPQAHRVIAERARELGAPLQRVATWDEADADAHGRQEVHPQATSKGTWIAKVRTPTTVYEVPCRLPHAVADNLPLAALALEAFSAATGTRLGPSIAAGFARLRWRGRFDILEATGDRPLTVVDGAHDPESISALLEGVSRLSSEPPVLLFATLSDKRASELCAALASSCQDAFTCEAPSPRTAPPELLADSLRAGSLRARPVQGGLEPALELATRRALELGAPLVITGSLYLAGAALALLGEDVSAAWESTPRP